MKDIFKTQPSLEDSESTSTIWGLYDDIFSNQIQSPSGLSVDLDQVLLTVQKNLDEAKTAVKHTVKGNFCNFSGGHFSGIGSKEMSLLNHDYNCQVIWVSLKSAIYNLIYKDADFIRQRSALQRDIYFDSFSGLGHGNKHQLYLLAALKEALGLFQRIHELIELKKGGVICCLDK